MAYSELIDIQGRFKNIEFSNESNITIDEVDNLIVQADALIDSYIGQRYTLPLTGMSDTSTNLLKMFSTTLVADIIKTTLQVKQSTNTEANQDVRGSFNTRMVMEALAAIAKGDMTLDGVVASLGTGGFYSNNYARDVTPVFRKDCQQW